MALESISAATNPAKSSTVSQEDKSRAGLSNNLSDFLKLLTTQLKNQDPTSPLDTSQFTDQLIGFSGVEQQINTNSKLDKLVQSQTTAAISTQLSSSVNYIGKMAEIETNQFELDTVGDPKFAYDVPKGTVNSVITITKQNGQVIGSFKGSNIEGKQNVTWDGKDGDGNRLPAGTYLFAVTLTDSANQNTSATTYAFGEVTSVEMDGDKTKVVIDDALVTDIDKVRSIEQKQLTNS